VLFSRANTSKSLPPSLSLPLSLSLTLSLWSFFLACGQVHGNTHREPTYFNFVASACVRACVCFSLPAHRLAERTQRSCFLVLFSLLQKRLAAWQPDVRPERKPQQQRQHRRVGVQRERPAVVGVHTCRWLVVESWRGRRWRASHRWINPQSWRTSKASVCWAPSVGVALVVGRWRLPPLRPAAPLHLDVVPRGRPSGTPGRPRRRKKRRVMRSVTRLRRRLRRRTARRWK
jgi:hypothetical protein